MNAKDRSQSQQDAIAKLAGKYLGPFSDDRDREHWEWVVGELVSYARIKGRPISTRGIVHQARQLGRTGQRFRTELRRLNGTVKYGLKSMGIIDTEKVGDDLQQYLTGIRELCSFIEETPGFKEGRGRGQAWLVLKKERLLEDTRGVLKDRGQPHGLTRNGHLTEFAAEIWNCANGTTVDNDAFSYAIDHLQKVDRKVKALVANNIADSTPRNLSAHKTPRKNRSEGLSKKAG